MNWNQRLIDLEEILDTEYEKLYYYRKKIAQGLSAPEEFRLQQQIKKEIKSNIHSCEAEYWEILEREANSFAISEKEAGYAIVQVVREVERMENTRSDSYPYELIRMLTEIREKLNEPEKAAAAKLKVALPLIPPIVSYELELDTQGSLRRAWEPIKSLLKKK